MKCSIAQTSGRKGASYQLQRKRKEDVIVSGMKTAHDTNTIHHASKRGQKSEPLSAQLPSGTLV